MAKLSQHRAAKHLGIASSTLSSYVRRGIAPRHVNLVGVRYFEVSDLDAWRNSRTVEAGQ
jgi:hypothetical protein